MPGVYESRLSVIDDPAAAGPPPGVARPERGGVAGTLRGVVGIERGVAPGVAL
jgi:hypothetical protein